MGIHIVLVGALVFKGLSNIVVYRRDEWLYINRVIRQETL